MGQQEYQYNKVVRKCGIHVPDSKLINDKYFASRRFDIAEDGSRIHTATAGGLLCISLSNPVLDYSNLMALTGFLTQNPKDVEQMYRRMLFNYFTTIRTTTAKTSVSWFGISIIIGNGNLPLLTT